MENLIEDAVRVLRGLPDDLQATAARAIIDYGACYDDDIQLSDEQVAEVERRMANPNRQFLSLSEVRNRLRHYGV